MKLLLFTHKSDIDGMGNAILASLAFKDLEYILCTNVHDLDERIIKEQQKGYLYNFDYIYITDLSISKEVAEILYQDKKLNNKIHIFDHHETPLKNGLNIYPNVTIEIKNNNTLTCATKIFYNYLTKEKYLESNNILDEFTEMIRKEDTYDWKRTNDQKSHDLAILYQSLGPKKFINEMIYKIKNNDKFIFTKEENNLIDCKKEEIKDKINTYLKTLEIINIDKYKIGVCFITYEYRNEVADYLLDIKMDIDAVAMIALDNSQISLRSIKDPYAPRIIAEKYQGGGHNSAAAIPLTKTRRLSIIDTIFTTTK